MALIALLCVVGLILPAARADAGTLGKETVRFVAVRYDFPNPGESTWYYRVTAGQAPALGPVVFELMLACMAVPDAGVWDGVDPDTLHSGGGHPAIVDPDPTTHLSGLKFGEGFAPGESRAYYFTVNGNFAQDEIALGAWRAGPVYDPEADGQTIPGPSRGCLPDGAPAPTDRVRAADVEPPAPALDFEKWVAGSGSRLPDDADEPPGVILPLPNEVNWIYVLFNTGNVPLTNIVITDDQEGYVTTRAYLAPGQGSYYASSSLLRPAIAGQYRNVGRAETTYDGVVVSDEDPAYSFGTLSGPNLDLEKLTNGYDADSAPGPQLLTGSEVTWAYIVTNVGDVPLRNIIVGDRQLNRSVCTIALLWPAQSQSCTASGVVRAGAYMNYAKAVGSWVTTDATGQIVAKGQVDDHDYSHYTGVAAGAASLSPTLGWNKAFLPVVDSRPVE